MTLRLCIPSKETWLKPNQAVSRAGELSFNEQFMVPAGCWMRLSAPPGSMTLMESRGN